MTVRCSKFATISNFTMCASKSAGGAREVTLVLKLLLLCSLLLGGLEIHVFAQVPPVGETVVVGCSTADGRPLPCSDRAFGRERDSPRGGGLSEADRRYNKGVKAYNKGSDLYRHGRFAEAETAFRQAIQFNPGDAYAYSYLGNALQAQRKVSEAIAAYENALRLDRSLSAAAQNLDDLRRYLAAASRQARAIAASNRANDAMDNERWADAVSALRELISLDPEVANYYENLAYSLRKLKRYDEAIAVCREALRRFSDRSLKLQLADVLTFKGEQLEQSANYDEAIAAYREALELNPDHTWTRDHLKIAETKKERAEQRERETKLAASRQTIIDQMVVDLREARTQVVDPGRVKGAPTKATKQPLQFKTSIDEIKVPTPRETAIEVQARVYEMNKEAARKRWLATIQEPKFRKEMDAAYELWNTGSTAEEKLRARAALEKAREEAIADLRKEIERRRQLQAEIERAKRTRDPLVIKLYRDSEAFLKSVERDADERLKQGLVLPEDSDLDLLFGPDKRVRVWPGQRNPRAPLPNPLQDQAKRQKIIQLIIWDRREKERIEAIFSSVDSERLFDDFIEATIERHEKERKKKLSMQNTSPKPSVPNQREP